MSERAAVIVIGAGVSGLAAAACLARAGIHTLLLEQNTLPREPQEALFALDPRLVAELQLSARGLGFSTHDLPLGVAGEMPLSLGRDTRAATNALARLSDADARAWPLYRGLLMTEARRLGRWWRSSADKGATETMLDRKSRGEFQRLCLTGADAWLGARFETPALLAALLWDASAGGFAVSEPGSALALVWRAAQEMATPGVIAKPGSLIASLQSALGMAQLRLQMRVTRICTKSGGVTGVGVADGSEIEADHVISTLSRSKTLALAGLPQASPAIAEAKILLRLTENFLPEAPPIRRVLVERLEAYADAHQTARLGQVAAELPMAWLALARDRIAVTARPVPASLTAEARARLAAGAVLALSRSLPGLARAVTGVDIQLVPHRAVLADLLAPPLTRLRTQIHGLYLAGEDAESLPCVAGRAARLAAQLVLSR